MELFSELLDSDDIKTVAVILEALFNIIQCGADHYLENDENAFLAHLEKINAVAKIEKLQQHKSDEVYNKAIKILETFYETENVI